VAIQWQYEITVMAWTPIEKMKFQVDIANQIEKLPDGTQVQFNVID